MGYLQTIVFVSYQLYIHLKTILQILDPVVLSNHADKNCRQQRWQIRYPAVVQPFPSAHPYSCQ